MKAVETGDYHATPVGRFSDKVRNLEDMILIALSDGRLPDSEKEQIRAFAKAINVNQDQINEMVSESKDRLRLQPAAFAEIAEPARTEADMTHLLLQNHL